jgi:AcrR family transcriptional regulator
VATTELVRTGKQERSVRTQRRLMEATVETLAEKGYAGTTLAEVQSRAGVSRGALLHHYRSKAELMVGVVHHVSTQRIDWLLDLAARPPASSARTAWAVKAIWSTFQQPFFRASLELWLAAAADPALRAELEPQEKRVGAAIRAMVRTLFDLPADAGAVHIELLIDSMRGAAARSSLRPRSSERRLVAGWIALMDGALGDPRLP